MEWLKQFLGIPNRSSLSGSSTRRITLNDPLVIKAPRIGFLNLLGSSGQAILKEDQAALGPLFASLEESDSAPPVCDVLLIYAHVQHDGSIAGTDDGLRELIRKSAAPIVMIASENSGDGYVAAGKRTGYGQANLVMTLKRKGPLFGQFFGQLFRRMFEGKTMPLAWVELAPQSPKALHINCPEIFAAGASHIVFRH